MGRGGPQAQTTNGLFLPEAPGVGRAERVLERVGDHFDRGAQRAQLARRERGVRELQLPGEPFALPTLRAHDGEAVRSAGAGQTVKRLPQLSHGAVFAGSELREQPAELVDALCGVAEVFAAQRAELLREGIVRFSRNRALPLGPDSRYPLRGGRGELAAQQVPQERDHACVLGRNPDCLLTPLHDAAHCPAPIGDERDRQPAPVRFDVACRNLPHAGAGWRGRAEREEPHRARSFAGCF